jgi:hypothetical protein
MPEKRKLVKQAADSVLCLKHRIIFKIANFFSPGENLLKGKSAALKKSASFKKDSREEKFCYYHA